MRRSPSIVPDHDVYLVLNRYGSGVSWCETDEEDADRQTLLDHLMEGQYSNPVRIVAFNTVEGWSRDVTDDIAEELRQRCADEGQLPASLLEFLDQHGGWTARVTGKL
ncbi:hypothetical protein [Bradyrhizobium sp. DASA03120]|uniref:hypothetical protein n=1 Tax=Bradyrhizobium sp. SMVTL-02 TaxID=3395917 RepID=UPI003F6FB9B5